MPISARPARRAAPAMRRPHRSKRPRRPRPDVSETRSTCPYCGVGCGVIVETAGGAITGVRGDPDHPANFGRLCSKGSTLHLTAAAPITRQSRLLHPMRREHRAEKARQISWDNAMGFATENFAQLIREHG